MANPVQQGLKQEVQHQCILKFQAEMANPVQQGLKLVGDRRPWRIAWAEMANPVQQGLKHGEPLTYVQVVRYAMRTLLTSATNSWVVVGATGAIIFPPKGGCIPILPSSGLKQRSDCLLPLSTFQCHAQINHCFGPSYRPVLATALHPCL